MSMLEKWKKKKEEETYRFRGSSKSSLEAKKEALEKEKERLRLRNEIRESSKEIKRLEHPTQEKARKGVRTAGSKIVRFMGETLQEGARVSSATTKQMRKRKRPRTSSVRLRTSKTFTAPTGNDVSLSGGIARTQIIEDNVMTKDFFGTGSDKKQLLESKELNDIAGSSMKKKKQNYF